MLGQVPTKMKKHFIAIWFSLENLWIWIFFGFSLENNRWTSEYLEQKIKRCQSFSSHRRMRLNIITQKLKPSQCSGVAWDTWGDPGRFAGALPCALAWVAFSLACFFTPLGNWLFFGSHAYFLQKDSATSCFSSLLVGLCLRNAQLATVWALILTWPLIQQTQTRIFLPSVQIFQCQVLLQQA